ncbi:hypothetical protein [Commensalibacter papalotli (ex Botero et al. 2024)]|uniref:SMODS and SLOG-associating 2TM effector domain-containing protein n=1 Tax=Commensalibacter papalotli (ex Botero et al. 2024) TaxID=2972766 RepID=A0ABM9HUT1_9PROT|nr:hypothetical protein [Commensalibacter papalotli (ex Botero et al. 2024)]CAI3957052.1 unnamed protein product [Commensalibacter papalotli (ex Botero et al. 2024)]CAI3957677.1 unnamed protein product [Commensalibacter papalotli (ex Botero et al. 2024)]
MKSVINWCKESMHSIIVVECLILWLLFCCLLYIFISHDFVKAFAPLIIGLLGALIAFGQFQLSKWQKDIAKVRFDQDIRDKKYDVLKRWSEVYYNIVNVNNNTEYSQLLMLNEKNSSLSDELCFTFSKQEKIQAYCDEIKTDFLKIIQDHNQYILSGRYNEGFAKNEMYHTINENRLKIMKARKSLLENAYKELL